MNLELVALKDIAVPAFIKALLPNAPGIKKDEIYHAIATHKQHGRDFYELAEYPPTNISDEKYIVHVFECKYFAPIDGIQDEITEALSAPAPKVKEFELVLKREIK